MVGYRFQGFKSKCPLSSLSGEDKVLQVWRSTAKSSKSNVILESPWTHTKKWDHFKNLSHKESIVNIIKTLWSIYDQWWSPQKCQNNEMLGENTGLEPFPAAHHHGVGWAQTAGITRIWSAIAQDLVAKCRWTCQVLPTSEGPLGAVVCMLRAIQPFLL